MLKVENLTKKFKKFTALDGVNLTIKDNEIFGFVGPNGAGKTTTMRIIAGLLLPDSGTVTLDGMDAVRDADEIKKQIGYMPDFFGAYKNMNAHEYMEYFAALYGMYGNDANKRGDELLELVNLLDKRDSYVDTMSRGMKQRLCMARCLIHDPKLLILDEPASGLDPRARFEMKEIMKSLKQMGKTVIISSHILPELAQMTTTIGIIEKGKIITKGSMDEIMDSMNKKSRISMKFYYNMDKAINILKEDELVDELALMEQTCSFIYKGSEEKFAYLLRKMMSEGILILEVGRTEENLEEIFMEITTSYENQMGGNI